MRRSEASFLSLHAQLRDEWRSQKGLDYAGAQPSTFRRNRRNLGGGADAHYYSESAYLRVMEYVRDMERNDRFISPILDRLVDNCVRNGFTYEPQTGDKKIDADLWARQTEWAANPTLCDAARKDTFPQQQRRAFRQRIADGGVFALPITDESDRAYGALQLLEYDRCRTPTNKTNKPGIVHGIEVDGRLAPIRYWFVRSVVDPFTRYLKLTDAAPIDAFDDQGHPQVYHCFKPSRFSQTRGVTAFHGCFDAAQILEDIDFSEMIRRKIAASIGLSIETDPSIVTPGDVQLGDRDTVTGANGFDDIIEQMSPGMILRLPRGKTAKLLGSNAIPGEQFVEHFKLILQSIAASVGLPLILLLLDAKETNFSGWRGAMDQAKIAFVCEQYLQEIGFTRPAVDGNVRRWMNDDKALARRQGKKGDNGQTIDLFRHLWHYPGWPYPQPLQDAQAAMIRNITGQASLRRINAENGDDFEDVASECVGDTEFWIDAAILACQRLKQTHGELAADLTWRDLYHRALPTGITINTSQTEVDQANPADSSGGQ